MILVEFFVHKESAEWIWEAIMFFSFFMLERKRTRKLKNLFYTSSPKAGIVKILSGIGAFFIFAILFLPSAGMSEEPHLTVLCGAAFSKPFDEIVTNFQKEKALRCI
jgi:hypothetical protein